MKSSNEYFDTNDIVPERNYYSKTDILAGHTLASNQLFSTPSNLTQFIEKDGFVD